MRPVKPSVFVRSIAHAPRIRGRFAPVGTSCRIEYSLSRRWWFWGTRGTVARNWRLWLTRSPNIVFPIIGSSKAYECLFTIDFPEFNSVSSFWAHKFSPYTHRFDSTVQPSATFKSVDFISAWAVIVIKIFLEKVTVFCAIMVFWRNTVLDSHTFLVANRVAIGAKSKGVLGIVRERVEVIVNSYFPKIQGATNWVIGVIFERLFDCCNIRSVSREHP